VKNKNIPYYLTAAALFILLKFGFTLANNDDLAFLLQPTDKLISLLTGSSSVYLDSGYYHQELNILIDKSCSGFNFCILCFLLFTYQAVNYFDSPAHKAFSLLVALVGAYVLTIFVNTSRIFASIVVQQQTNPFLTGSAQLIVHEAVGIITNLTFLILAYYLIEKRLTKKEPNAKFA
jgi:exosortase K